jgi:hypothetical protein
LATCWRAKAADHRKVIRGSDQTRNGEIYLDEVAQAPEAFRVLMADERQRRHRLVTLSAGELDRGLRRDAAFDMDVQLDLGEPQEVGLRQGRVHCPSMSSAPGGGQGRTSARPERTGSAVRSGASGLVGADQLSLAIVVTPAPTPA